MADETNKPAKPGKRNNGYIITYFTASKAPTSEKLYETENGVTEERSLMTMVEVHEIPQITPPLPQLSSSSIQPTNEKGQGRW